MTRSAGILLALCLFVYLYVECLGRISQRRNRFRFRLVDLLILITAVTILSGVATVGNAAVIGALIPYSIVSGPLWSRLAERRPRITRTGRLCLVSAMIVSSYVVILTSLAAIMFIVLSIKEVAFPTWLSFMLYPSAVFSFLCVLGDTAESDAQLVLYGLPGGVLINLVLGLCAGGLLGAVVIFRQRHANESVVEQTAIVPDSNLAASDLGVEQAAIPRVISSSTKARDLSRGRGNQLLLLIACLAVVLAGGLQSWAHYPEATIYALKLIIVGLAIGMLLSGYIRSVGYVVGPEESFRFRQRDLLILTTAIIVLSAAGLAGDALVLSLWIVYAIWSGPTWKRLVSPWFGTSRVGAVCGTSAAIVASSVAILTCLAMFVYIWASLSSSRYTIWIASRALSSSEMFDWVCPLNDNYRGELQLLIYGILIGIPLNLAIGLLAGAALGLAAHLHRSPHAND